MHVIKINNTENKDHQANTVLSVKNGKKWTWCFCVLPSNISDWYYDY